MNKEGFLILLELCTVYFAFQYVAVVDPAAGFQVKKKSRFVQNFLKKKYFLKNSDFFTKDVLTPLLGGMKTISGIYHVVFVQ